MTASWRVGTNEPSCKRGQLRAADSNSLSVQLYERIY